MFLAKIAFRSNPFSGWYKEMRACTCTDRLAFHRPGGVAVVPFFLLISLHWIQYRLREWCRCVSKVSIWFGSVSQPNCLHKLVYCLLISPPIRDILWSQLKCIILNKIHLSEITLVSYIVVIVQVYCVESHST